MAQEMEFAYRWMTCVHVNITTLENIAISALRDFSTFRNAFVSEFDRKNELPV